MGWKTWIAALAAAASLSSPAATRTWIGSDGGVFSNAANWAGGAPASGDRIVFVGNGSATNDLAGISFASLATSGTRTFMGNFSFSTATPISGTGNATFAGTVTVPTNTIITFD